MLKIKDLMLKIKDLKTKNLTITEVKKLFA